VKKNYLLSSLYIIKKTLLLIFFEDLKNPASNINLNEKMQKSKLTKTEMDH